MAQVDLRSFSFEELDQLAQAIEVEKRRRQDEDRQQILHDARAMAARYGLSVEQFLATPATKTRTRAQVKYRNPTNPRQTWSGRGKQPAWVKNALATGVTLHDLEDAGIQIPQQEHPDADREAL